MKPRRDITLGEMQDECKKYWNNGNLGSCGKCQYMEVCCHYEAYAPAQLNLTDPPRFTEAQMGFWGFWFSIGARFAKIGTHDSVMAIYFYKNDHASWESYMGFVVRFEGLGQLEVCNGETLDIAELLGKDGSET